MQNNNSFVFMSIIMFILTTIILYLGYQIRLTSSLLFWAIIVLGYLITLIYVMMIKSDKSS